MTIRDDQIVSLVAAILLAGVKDGPDTPESAVEVARAIVFRFGNMPRTGPCFLEACRCVCHEEEP